MLGPDFINISIQKEYIPKTLTHSYCWVYFLRFYKNNIQSNVHDYDKTNFMKI